MCIVKFTERPDSNLLVYPLYSFTVFIRFFLRVHIWQNYFIQNSHAWPICLSFIQWHDVIEKKRQYSSLDTWRSTVRESHGQLIQGQAGKVLARESLYSYQWSFYFYLHLAWEKILFALPQGKKLGCMFYNSIQCHLPLYTFVYYLW